MKMKKNNLLILAVAALGFAACANDETTAVNEKLAESNAISFRANVAGNMRAVDIDGTVLRGIGFKVFATTGSPETTYFSETDYTWDDKSSYTSANKHYWPSSGTLNFYAYAKNGSNTITHTDDTKVFVITPAAAAADQSDFVFANTNGKTKDGTYDTSKKYGHDGVPLNFRHAMSKVTVQFKNSNPYVYVTVKDAAICYLNTVGTYTYSGSTGSQTSTDTKDTYNLKFTDWTSQTGTGSYSQTLNSPTGFSSSTAATALPNPYILVPQTLIAATQYSAAASTSEFHGAYIKANIKIQNGNTNSGAYIVGGDGENYQTVMWPLQAIDWNPGYHYIYTVDLAGGGYYETNHDEEAGLDPVLEDAEIKFVSVTVDAWDPANYTVGNMVYAQGGSYTGNIVKDAGEYTITITGLTSGDTVTPSTTVGTVSAAGTAGTDGTFSFSLTVDENTTGASKTVTVTVTETGTTSGTTTITLTQAAS